MSSRFFSLPLLLIAALVTWSTLPTVQADAAPTAKVAAPTAAPVKLHSTIVFSIAQDHAGKSASARAALASAALKQAARAEDGGEVRVESLGTAANIYAGRTKIVVLYPQDAGAAGLDAHAATVSSAVRKALHEERARNEIADVVFSISLAIFFGLCALYAWRKIGEFVESARLWAERNPERLSSIRLQSFEVVGPTALRAGVQLTLFLTRWFLQLGIAYLWLIFSLSRFDATAPYTARLTGFVLTPLSELAARLAAALPLLLMAVVFGVVIYVSLRFVRLLSVSVARGDTKLTWLAADFARPASAILSLALIVTALLFVAPVVTGDADGALTRIGAIAVLALGIASTPVLAAGLVGALLVFGRGLRVGQRIEVLGAKGQVRAIQLLELRISQDDGGELRIPHLVCLWHPIRLLGSSNRLCVELSIAPSASYAEALEILRSAARGFGEESSVELLDMHADGSRYRIEVTSEDKNAGDLRIALADALSQAHIALGKPAFTGAAPLR